MDVSPVRELYHAALFRYLESYKERRFGNEDEHFHQIMSGFLKVVIVSGKTPEWAANLLELDVDEAVAYYNSPDVQGDLLPQLRELLALKFAFCNIKCNKPMLQLYSHTDVQILGTRLSVIRSIGSNIFEHLPQSILQGEHGQLLGFRDCPPGYRTWKSRNRKDPKFDVMSGPIGDRLFIHDVFNYGRTRSPSADEENDFKQLVTDLKWGYDAKKLSKFLQQWYSDMREFDADLHMFGQHAQYSAMNLMTELRPPNTTLTPTAMLLTVILSSAFNRDNDYALHYALCERYKKSVEQIERMVNHCHESGFFFDPTRPDMVQRFSEYPLKFLINGHLIPLTRQQANEIHAKSDMDAQPNGWPWIINHELPREERQVLDKLLLTAFRRGNAAPNHDEETFVVSAFAELRSQDIAQMDEIEIHDAVSPNAWEIQEDAPCSSTSFPDSLLLTHPSVSDDSINGVKNH